MKKLYMLMFALLVSSKGFCVADEEMPGDGAAAASAKPIEDTRKHIMFEEISTDDNERLIEERAIYNRHAARLPVVFYTSSGPLRENISGTLQSMLRDLKPGQKVIIRGISVESVSNVESNSTVDAISKCGVVLSYVFPIMRAGIFMKK